MSSIKSSPSLYLELNESEIERKRIFVSLIDNENIKQSIIIQESWTTLKCLLVNLIVSFKVPTCDDVALMTTDGTIITSLSSIVNNQVLRLAPGIPTPKPQPQQQSQPTHITPHSNNNQSNTTVTNNNIWDREYDCHNQFLNAFYRLKKEVYGELIQIGESKPYCARLYVANRNDMSGSSAWVYFIEEQPKTLKTMVYSKSVPLYNILVKVLDHVSSPHHIAHAVEELFVQFNKFAKTAKGNAIYVPNLDYDLQKIFPSTYKIVSSISYPAFFIECLKFEEELVNLLKVNQSIAKHNLLKTRMNVGSTAAKIKRDETLQECRGRNDVRHYRFVESSCLTDKMECPVCYDDEVAIIDMVQLECGHYFCKECFQQFIKTELENNLGNYVPIQCPNSSCVQVIDSVTIACQMTSESQHKRFTQQLFTDYLNASKSHICRSRGCQRVVMRSFDDSLVIPYSACSCNRTICYFCGEDGCHWPSPCGSTGLAMDPDELDSIRYLVSFATLCPNCRYPVERTTGCNHMTCSQCKSSFCYACGLLLPHPPGPNGTFGCKGEVSRKMLVASSIVNANSKIVNSPHLLLNLADNRYESLFIIRDSFEKYAKCHNMGDKGAAHIGTIIMSLTTVLETKMEREEKLIAFKQLTKSMGYVYQRFTREFRKIIVQHDETQYNKVRTLSCNVNLNGVSDTTHQVFVKRCMTEWKQDMIELFGIKPQTIDTSKVTIYTLGGSVIKSPKHVVHDEQIYIALHGEPYLDPQPSIVSSSPSTSPHRHTKSNNRKRSSSTSSSTSSHHDRSNNNNIYNQIQELRDNPNYRLTPKPPKNDDQIILELIAKDMELFDEQFNEQSKIYQDDYYDDQYDNFIDETGTYSSSSSQLNQSTCALSMMVTRNHNHIDDYLDDDFFDTYHPFIDQFEKKIVLK